MKTLTADTLAEEEEEEEDGEVGEAINGQTVDLWREFNCKLNDDTLLY